MSSLSINFSNQWQSTAINEESSYIAIDRYRLPFLTLRERCGHGSGLHPPRGQNRAAQTRPPAFGMPARPGPCTLDRQSSIFPERIGPFGVICDVSKHTQKAILLIINALIPGGYAPFMRRFHELLPEKT